MRSLVFSLLAITPTAYAEGEISGEFQAAVTYDSAWWTIDYNDLHPGGGVHLSYTFTETKALSLRGVAGWTGFAASSTSTANVGGTGVFAATGSRSAFMNDVEVGIQTSFRAAKWFEPRLRVSGALWIGSVKIQDNATEPMKYVGVTGGITGLAGFQFVIPTKGSVWPTIHLDAGYAWAAQMAFQTLGNLQPGGFVARAGMGVRWGKN